MIASTKTPQLFHAPYTCSLAVRLAAAWGNVPLDILPTGLGSKARADLIETNPLAQVSTLILPDETILTETSACLIWVQTQSQKSDFKRTPDQAEYFQMLRWIGFCATELHKQLLRIVFYDEATESVKQNFRTLAKSRLAILDKHLTGRDLLVGDTLSAADAYLTWFLTLSSKAGVDIAPYISLKTYADRQMSDTAVKNLLTDDAAIKATISI